MHIERPDGGRASPHPSRDMEPPIQADRSEAAQFLTYPHLGRAATRQESAPKVRSRPFSHLWIILGMDCRGSIGGAPCFVHAFQLKMTNDPVLIAYAVKRAPSSGQPVWTRIGSAYPHDTGAGLTVVLDAMPFDGRVVLLERSEEDDERLQRRLAQLAREV